VATLYATVADLVSSLSGTDSGTGTPVQLSTAQLTLALQRASSTVSVYAGNTYDGSSPAAVPPDIFHDLTLDLAGFWAWKTYLKGKEVPSAHPAYIAFQNAMTMLEAARKGELRLDPAVAGGIGSEIGAVYNRIPPVFTGDDSNVRINPYTGTLESDVPFNQWSPGGQGLVDAGPVYQG
jgi:hypothetical protein